MERVELAEFRRLQIFNLKNRRLDVTVYESVPVKKDLGYHYGKCHLC